MKNGFTTRNNRNTGILYTIVVLLLTINTVVAQNNTAYFKTIPSQSSIAVAPDWAQLLYQEDPVVQDVIDAYQLYFKTNEFKKTIHTQNYKYWINKVVGNLNEEGKIRPKSRKEEDAYFKSLKAKLHQKNSNTQGVNWECIGPFETYRAGSTTPVSIQANIYAIDQSVSNPNLVICGTESGGVFKSTNKGSSWDLISLNEPFCRGIEAVAISPVNNNVFYITGQSRLYQTTNGGISWTELSYIGGSVYEIKFDPANANHMWLTTQVGLLESTNGGTSWTTRYSEKTWDLDYHPTNSNVIYMLKENTASVKQEFYKSSNNGATWSLITSGWYNPENVGQAAIAGGKIGISSNDPNRVYAALIGDSKTGDNGWIGVYRSNDAGQNWYLPAGQIGGPYSAANTSPWNVAAYSSGYHQGFYNFDFEVSPSNANLFWIGTIRLTESNDGGASFTSIGAAQSQRLTDIHADIQTIHISGNDIWIGSDGGIDLSTDNLMTSVSKKYGISASQYWGMGMGWNEDIVVGGRYHNGDAALYQAYGLGNSHKLPTGGAEEPTGFVNLMDNFIGLFGVGSVTATSTIPKSLGDGAGASNNINFRPNESYVQWDYSGFFNHPNYSDHMIAGKDAAIWETKDGGASWNVMHDFGTGRVLELEYNRANPAYIYGVNRTGASYWDPCKIYRSTDEGATWNALTDPPSNSKFRLLITTNPANENELWAASADGTNGQKIYQSVDGGVSWTNKTTSVLDGAKIYDIEYHGGSNGVVYVLTEDNFFYYDPGSSEWIQFNTGLPLNLGETEKKVFKIFYKDQNIKLATSRGIWEVDLPLTFAPIAEPLAVSNLVSCEQDLVELESHSMVDQNSVQWFWNISPTPSYLSNPYARNPKVVFGTAGDYTVSLTVTNSTGQSNTKSVDAMITVGSCSSACAPCSDCYTNYSTNGTTIQSSTGCCFEITPLENWKSGSFWGQNSLNFSRSFQMTFDIDLGNISGSDADGAALVFQNQGLNAIGGPGGLLGANGINNSLTVAFKTYVYDRIEIWKDGDNCCDLSGGPVSISGSGSHPVSVSWDADLQVLYIDWENDGVDIIFANDVVNNFFNGNSNDIIWGFTAGTGGLNAKHTVCNIAIDFDYCVPSYTQVNNNKLVGTQNKDVFFETDGNIESNQVIPANQIVTYDSGTEICLDAGFEVISSATFLANIEGGCSDGFTCPEAIPVEKGMHKASGPNTGNGANATDATHANWFRYIATATGTIDVFSCNSGVDTRLWVYEGKCDNLIANSDNECPMFIGGGFSYASALYGIPVVAGNTYFLEWDDRWSMSGFEFEIR